MLIPGLPALLDPDPWALLIWDWRAGCAPGRGRGAQAGPGCDSFLPTQPSSKWGGWPAGAGAQPLTSCRHPAQGGLSLQRPQKHGLGKIPGPASPTTSKPTPASAAMTSPAFRALDTPDISPIPTPSPPIITSPGTPPPPPHPLHRVPPSPLTWRMKEFGLCSQKTTLPSQLPGVDLEQVASFVT